MKHKKTIVLFSICTFSFLLSAFITDKTVISDKPLFSDLFRNFITSYPGEKYIINTDRDLYFINENIWYNIWCLDDITDIPVTRSTAIYVELIGNDSIPVLQQSIILENNVGTGRMIIPYNLPSGLYYLRAYSSWQKNFGVENFGIRIIQVINPYNIPVQRNLSSQDLEINYFPEGGKILEGISNKVLVETRSKHGTFTNTDDLEIRDQNDSLISNLQNLSVGMWIFDIIPEPGQQYFIVDNSGVKKSLKIQNEGLNIGLIQLPGIVRITVKGKKMVLDEDLHLVARNSGNIFYEKGFQFHNAAVDFDIPLILYIRGGLFFLWQLILPISYLHKCCSLYSPYHFICLVFNVCLCIV